MPGTGYWLFKIGFCDASPYKKAIKLALAAIPSKAELNTEYRHSALY